MALRTCNGRGNILSRGDARVPCAPSLVHPSLRTHTHAPGRLHLPYNQRIISNATTARPTCAAHYLTSARARAGSGQTGQPQKRLLFQGMFTAPLAGGAGGRLQTIRVLPRNFPTPLYVFFFYSWKFWDSATDCREVNGGTSRCVGAHTIHFAQKGTLCNSSGSYLGTSPAVCFAHHPDTHSDAMTRQICN